MYKLFLILLILPFITHGKSGNQALIDITAGVGSGWWVFNKGSSDGTQDSHLGYDHTRAAGITSFETNIFYKRNRFKIGAGFEYAVLLEDKMRETEHRLGRSKEYFIADRFVRFYKFNLVSEYNLFEGRRYTLSPQIRLGSFMITTTHPAAANFGFRIHWSIGVNNQLTLTENIFLLIRPFYNALTIWPKQELNQNERHHIYSFGLAAGFRFKLNRNNKNE